MPPIPWRNGDFSGFGARTVYDPETYDAATNTRLPFAGNIIPQSRFDPVTPKFRDWWPTPQTSAVSNNYFFTPPNVQDFFRWDGRYDQNLTSKDNFYLRMSGQHRVNGRVPQLPDSGDFKQGARTGIQSYHLVGVYNRVWRPNLVMSVRAGWTMIDTAVKGAYERPLNGELGIERGTGLDLQIDGASAMQPSGFQAVGGVSVSRIVSQTRQLTWDFNWTKGNHSIKFGQTIYWLQSFIFNLGNSVGGYPFDGRFTADPGGANGESMADYLLGWNHQAWNENFRHTRLRAPWYQQYIQDDWRLNDRLTLNFGFRYSVNLPWVEKGDRIAMWDEDTDPNNPQFVTPDPSLGWDGRAMEDTDWTNFAPRFGFAYRLKENTVLRGGYGIFYGNTMNTGGAEQKLINPPFHIRVLLTTDRTQPSLRVSRPLPSLDPEKSPPLTPT
ncbi:MAG: TonB-dependent receptor, partial [bacterium]|nr:TonB-dependent receptor [bacterium]